MNKFDWSYYKNCYFNPTHYLRPKNKALEIKDDEGTVSIVSVNTDEILNEDEIMIKNYSEGKGNDIRLIKMGIIKKTPDRFIRSGLVVIPIYKLTKKGMKLWKENQDA